MNWMMSVISDFPQIPHLDAASLQRSFIVLEMFNLLILMAIYGVCASAYGVPEPVVATLLLIGTQQC
jgi:hypothetical protein